MRILVISRSPWDNSNSFGNTFSNLFGGIEGIEIYSICCQEGHNNNTVVKKAYQMTDKLVLNSIINNRPGHVIGTPSAKIELTSLVSFKLPKKLNTIFYIARDLIWKIGRWCDKGIKEFLDEAMPDIIYLPIYASWYMCDVQQKVIEYCKVPVVGHITDDIYNYPPSGWKQPLSYLYRMNVRKKVRKLISKCSYVEVFAENMACEYAKIFNKPFYVIGKGVDLSKVEDLSIWSSFGSSICYVYTGNIGNGRYLELAKLAKALDKSYPDGRAELKIYTQSMIEDGIEEAFSDCKSVKLCGSVPSNEVLCIQLEADVLVYVESFSNQSIFETKMSFSTKLIDYMLAGKVIFAIGPTVVYSLETIRHHNLAVTACSDTEIEQQVEAIKNGWVDYVGLTDSIKKYLVENRDIRKIQSGMIARLNTQIILDKQLKDI